MQVLKHFVHAKWPKNVSEVEAFCRKQWVKKLSKQEHTDSEYKKHLQTVISAKGGVITVGTDVVGYLKISTLKYII